MCTNAKPFSILQNKYYNCIILIAGETNEQNYYYYYKDLFTHKDKNAYINGVV